MNAENALSALPNVLRPSPGKRISMVLAVTVHLLLLGILIYGIRWQNQAPVAIEVELVRAAPPSVDPLPPQAEQPPPQAAPPGPVAEPKPEPRIESQPTLPPKPDIALKEKEKPKPAPKEKPKQVPRELPQPSPAPFQKQLEQELKQAAERKDAAAAAQELAQLKAAQAVAGRDQAIADYVGKIRGKIKGNIVLPADLKGNPEAVFDVVQLPGGEILHAKLNKSSGHAGYDAAVERAILKSSPLPKPERAELFSRELELKFRPREE